MKKVISILLAVMLVFSVGATAFAAPNEEANRTETTLAAKGIKFSPNKLTVREGKKQQLSVSWLPGTKKTSLKWYTSDKSTVAIDAKRGLIKGQKVGSAIITVVSKDGYKAKCKVTVAPMVKSLRLSKSDVTLRVGKTATLRPIVSPRNAQKGVKYYSSNTKVATVDAKGKVRAVGNGNATITAKVTDGSGKKAYCKVNVPVLTEKMDIAGSICFDWRPQFGIATPNDMNINIRPIGSSTKLKVVVSDPTLLKIEEKGVNRYNQKVFRCTPLKPGEGKITFYATDGSGKFAWIKFQIHDPYEDFDECERWRLKNWPVYGNN